VAIGLFGWAGFKSRGRSVPARAWLLAAWTVPGAVLGVLLALRLPIAVYHGYLLVVMLAVLWQQWRNRLPPLAPATGGSRFAAAVALTLVGVHMGFAQVGVGLVAILALSRYHSRDLIEVNTTKMALVLVAASTSMLEFTRNAAIAWGPALVLALAAGAGSFFASRWSVAKGHAAVRVVVLVIAAAVVARTAWQLLW
jgi:uncharacterized membrane protein YfcA